jgi:hypothetical protein
VNYKRFFVPFALMVGIILVGLSAVTFTPISAQISSQGFATPIPNQPRPSHFQFPQVLVDQLALSSFNTQPSSVHYVSLTDDVDALSMETPSDWSDIETGPWIVQGQTVGIFIAAAPDLGAFYASRAEPGVFFGASRDLVGSTRVMSPAEVTNPVIGKVLLDEEGSRQGRCQDGGRFSYRDNFYLGDYDVSLNCASGSRGEITLVTMPPDQQYMMLLRIHITNQADMAAAAHILDTYQVINPSLKDEDDGG